MHLYLPGGEKYSITESIALINKYSRATIALYDFSNKGPHDELEDIDILSLNALNAFNNRSAGTVMANIWYHCTEIEEQITSITKENFYQLSEQNLYEEIDRISYALYQVESLVNGLGPVGASKLLHRLRPNIIPLWDNEVDKWYEYLENDNWRTYLNEVFDLIRDANNLMVLKEIRKRVNLNIHLLRIWDIILWESD